MPVSWPDVMSGQFRLLSSIVWQLPWAATHLQIYTPYLQSFKKLILVKEVPPPPLPRLQAGFCPFLTIPTLFSEVPLILVQGQQNLDGIFWFRTKALGPSKLLFLFPSYAV